MATIPTLDARVQILGEEPARFEVVGVQKIKWERCRYTNEVLAIPEEVHEQVRARDPQVANKEFPGFYVSPEFCYYSNKNFSLQEVN